MPNGYWDRILHVDLGSGATRVESFGEGFWRRHLGGRSLIAHYLLTEVPVGTDPLSPENVLIFAAGVLTGTPFPGSGRHSVGAKSPMTGLFGESEAGGFWGAERSLRYMRPACADLARNGWAAWNVEYRRVGRGPLCAHPLLRNEWRASTPSFDNPTVTRRLGDGETSAGVDKTLGSV